jgi:arginase
MRRIAVLDAPSNLGLRPPTPGSVPGCAKAPGALRDRGLVTRLGARDAGCHTAPRFDPGEWRPGDGVSQASQIAAYSLRLAERVAAIVDAGEFPLVLGGDCSISIGTMLAMNRLGEDLGGRIGLVYIDAHSDFRHPGNASVVGAAAGEALALVTGRGQADLAAIEQRRPYVRDQDVVLLGLRSGDEYRMDLQAAGFAVRAVPDVRTLGAARTAQWARTQLAECAGFWLHLDVDVLDPSVMPAVDAPDPGGIAYPELELLVRGLIGGANCVGMEVTVFDPDFDVDGRYALDLTDVLITSLKRIGTWTPGEESPPPGPKPRGRNTTASHGSAAASDGSAAASDGSAAASHGSAAASHGSAIGPNASATVPNASATVPNGSTIGPRGSAAVAHDSPVTPDDPATTGPVIPSQSKRRAQKRLAAVPGAPPGSAAQAVRRGD